MWVCLGVEFCSRMSTLILFFPRGKRTKSVKTDQEELYKVCSGARLAVRL
jgi:hypothetical protein